MIRFKSLLLMLMGLFLLSSCSTSEEETLPSTETFEGGFFVLNEGGFGSENASVSYLDPSRGEMSHHIFQSENDVEVLGDVGQNMKIHGDHIYIVLNGSNRVEVVDRYSFEQVATLESQLQNPRDVSFAEGKAFVSNWGDGSVADDDFLAVFSTSDFSYQDKIAVEEGPEEVISGSGYIFTSHLGGWSSNTVVSVIDPVNLTIIKTIEVGDRPNTMAVSGEKLYVLSEGQLEWSSEESAGRLTQVNLGTLEIDQQLVFPSVSDHPSHLVESDGNLFYTLNNELYGLQAGETSLPQESLLLMEEVDFLYGLNIKNGEVFATSANTDFSSNGKLVIYDLSGQLLDEFETGINPNGILFN